MNLCVLASGRGSNLKSIIDSYKKGKIISKVVLVISNNSNSNALNIARSNQIPAYHLSQKQFSTEQEYVKAFLDLLEKHKVDMIILAGYMKLLPAEIVRTFQNKILNIHPALLPSFCGQGMYGMKVHEAVISYGAKVSGASVHIVDEIYDNGPVVIQRTVKVADEDTPETLQKKVLKIEHKLFPEAIKLFETKKPTLVGRRVVFN
ncbi:MAG: phosphoribosylglycinamide formyltransferase [Ignavibacteria bacterium]